jgi:hypothetical protein
MKIVRIIASIMSIGAVYNLVYMISGKVPYDASTIGLGLVGCFYLILQITILVQKRNVKKAKL